MKRARGGECVGGPEDGRILNTEIVDSLPHGVEVEGMGRIPVIVRDSDLANLNEDDDVELVLLGVYVRKEIGNKVHYEWIARSPEGQLDI